jgi:probable HAF family extracellular repeat protein
VPTKLLTVPAAAHGLRAEVAAPHDPQIALIRSKEAPLMKRNARTQRWQLESLEPRRLLTTYSIDLGTLGGAISVPADINASGQVVGTSIRADGGERAFLWQNGVMTDLGTLGGDYSRALGMNDVGQVVGQSASGAHIVRAFLVTPEDTDGNGTADRWYRDTNSDGKNDLMRDLGTLGGSYNFAVAFDVNNSGQVVGDSSISSSSGSVHHAFRWQSGVMTDLGTFGGQHSSAKTINDAGQVAGWFYKSGSSRAFLWKSGVATDLGISRGVTGINGAGRLVDNYFGTARVWTPTVPNGSSGTFATLGQLPSGPDAGVESAPLGINEAGQVVGYQQETIYGEGGNAVSIRGVRWTNGAPQALRLETASASNDAGQIVGTLGGRAYLLTEEHLVMPLLTIDGGAAVTEGSSGTADAAFTVNLSRASTQSVTVHYATADDSAAAGVDYVATSGTLTFAPGQTSKNLSVKVLGDRVPEYPSAETFSLVLSAPSNALMAGETGTGVIVDDEPSVSSGGITVREGNAGTTTALLNVNLSVAYDQTVSFDYATADQTAVAGSDYVATSGTVTFAPGETTRQIPVSILGDHVAEVYAVAGYLDDLEHLGFTVSNPSANVTLFGLASLAIQDDEPRVTISTYVPVTEPAAGTIDAHFTVSLSAAYDRDVVVEYGTFETNEFGPPASAGSDYVATSGSVRIPAGQTIGTIAVPVVGDGVAEPVEYLYVFLTSVSGNATIDGGGWGVGEIRDYDGSVKTWIGPASGNWSTAANWNPVGVPDAGDVVTISGKAVSIAAGATVAALNLTGAASLNVATGGNFVVRTSGLAIDGTSKLNLSDNDLILDYAGGTPFDEVVALLASGRQAVPGGIFSPQANASGGRLALGVSEASDVLGLVGTATGTFSGRTVDATTVLVKFTSAGDADIDGNIGFRDLVRLAQNYNSSAGGKWSGGDFNYDGRIGFADLVLLAQNYDRQESPTTEASTADVATAMLSSTEPRILTGRRRIEDRTFNNATAIRKPAPVAKAGPAIRNNNKSGR